MVTMSPPGYPSARSRPTWAGFRFAQSPQFNPAVGETPSALIPCPVSRVDPSAQRSLPLDREISSATRRSPRHGVGAPRTPSPLTRVSSSHFLSSSIVSVGGFSIVCFLHWPKGGALHLLVKQVRAVLRLRPKVGAASVPIQRPRRSVNRKSHRGAVARGTRSCSQRQCIGSGRRPRVTSSSAAAATTAGNPEEER